MAMMINPHNFGEPEVGEIDPSRWSGVPTDFEFDADRQESLSRAVDQALADLDALGAGNAEKAQARAILMAMQVLKDAPDPPIEIIWKLLERGMAIVGVCELFYRIAEVVIG